MNQIKDNPFPYSEDHKRYYTISYYLKKRFGCKCAKIPLDAGFTCPNRDGSKAVGGCTFCSYQGSGDTILAKNSDLKTQFEAGLERVKNKWPSAKGIPYFQSYSNTYADLQTLKDLYTPYLEDESIPALCIATRADCIEPAFIDFLSRYALKKEIWIELGLQSFHDVTMDRLNRAHSSAEVFECVKVLKNAGIKTCLHIINGLPGESYEMMMETARQVSLSKADAIKIHMLHIIANSQMGVDFQKEPFELMSLQEYVQLVCDQLEILPADMIIERISSDGIADQLIAPLWTRKKTIVANEIDKELFKRGSYQSKKYPVQTSYI
jgi:hypothetical protein